jgi:mercuric ion binding protein
MFKYLLTFVFGLFLHTAVAQSQPDNVELKLKTSAQCDMCKKRIEKKISLEKGVKSVVLDVDSKVLTIVYNKTKTDAKALKTAVSKVGYDAEDVVADPTAYKKLPECCQKGGH